MEPILLDLPVPITTERLLLRPAQAGDGNQVNEAILESFDDLTKWMAWARSKPTVDETELFARTTQANWILRKELTLFIFDRKSGQFLGGTGFHSINWHVPLFEIGYWIRSSHKNQGITTEATHAQLLYAFKQLKAVRVHIKCDEDNFASRRIPEKLGFVLEGILKNNELKYDNNGLGNTAVYARYDVNGLPQLEVNW